MAIRVKVEAILEVVAKWCKNSHYRIAWVRFLFISELYQNTNTSTHVCHTVCRVHTKYTQSLLIFKFRKSRTKCQNMNIAYGLKFYY